MAKPKAGAQQAPSQPKFGVADLWRLTLWGVSAAGAVALAIYAGTTEMGQARLRTAFAGVHENLMPSGAKPIEPLDAREGRRLAETMRVLAADRERLMARVEMLEHSVEDMTGSIARVQQAARTPPPAPIAPPPEAAAAPETVAPAQAVPAVAVEAAPPPARMPAPVAAPAAAPAEDVTASVTPQQPVAPPLPSGKPKKEFGLDLGSATTVEELRTAWTAALRRHGALLEGLHPLVRERPRAGGTDFHLIAGPLFSAATAARLCATMAAAGGICAPSAFDGQRLAVR